MSTDVAERPETEVSHASARRRRALRAFFGTPGGMIGTIIMVLLLAMALFGGLLTQDPLVQTAAFEAPSGAHPFGTDELGRDLLARVVVGTGNALYVALASALLGCALGVPLGLIAGYKGGWVDSVIMRVFDVILGVPAIVVALLIVAILGGGNLNVILAIASAVMPNFGRLARASTLTVREREYVVAARSMGATDLDIMFRTVLRNITSPIIVQFIIAAGVAIVVSASLSFLGLGVSPPTPTWGGMLESARDHLDRAPLYAVFPGVALTLTIAGFDGIGRALQRAMGTKVPSRSELRRTT